MNARVLVPRIISGRIPDAGARTLRLAGRSMGCQWQVALVVEDTIDLARIEAGICAVLDGVVQQMSTWEPASDISRFNCAPAGTWLPMPADFALVLGCAQHVAAASAGALDATAGELVRLWGFGSAGRYSDPGFQVPTPESVGSALQTAGWQRLQVDVNAMRMYQPGGLQLDLSAVAKGFAVDVVSRYLRGEGLLHHLVDIGGELRGEGRKPDGLPWWVELQHPPAAQTLPVTRIALHGLSVATSGDYLQSYTRDGRRFTHCIDPRTGRPVQNGVLSVTVLHRDCMLADAWSTALMVLGAEAGLRVAEDQQIAALWLVRASDAVHEQASSAFEALVARGAAA